MNLTAPAADEAVVGERSSQHGRALAGGVMQLIVGRVVAGVLTFSAWAVLARTLQPEGFGALSFVLAVFAYVTIASDLGLTTLGTREFGRPGGGAPLVRRVLGARLMLAAATVAVVATAALVAPLSEANRAVALLLAVSLVPSSITLTWVLRGQERSRPLAAIDVLGAAVFLVLTLILVRQPSDVVWAAVAITAVTGLSALVSVIFVRPGRAALPEFSRDTLRLLRRAVPIGVSAFAISIYWGVDWILLGVLRSSTEVGLYAAAYRFVLPLLAVAQMFGSLALPAISRVLHDDPAAVQPLLRASSRTLMALALPAAVGTTLTARPIVLSVLGPDYVESAVPLAILIWTCVTVFANAPFGFLMLARRQDRAYMWIAIVGAAANVTLNLLLIPLLGMTGAAAATIVAEVVVLALMLAATWGDAVRALLPALRAVVPPTAVMAVCVWPFRDSMIAVPIGIVVYVALALALGAIPATRLRRLVTTARQPDSRQTRDD